jgi:hypothetical protein
MAIDDLLRGRVHLVLLPQVGTLFLTTVEAEIARCATVDAARKIVRVTNKACARGLMKLSNVT